MQEKDTIGCVRKEGINPFSKGPPGESSDNPGKGAYEKVMDLVVTATGLK